MKITRSVSAAVALALVVVTAPAALARDDDRRKNDVHQRYDVNRDGVVARSEFRGSDEEFARLDRNRDGVLTTSMAANRSASNNAAALELELGQYDRNSDSRTRREWLDARQNSHPLDVNGDGRLTDLDYHANRPMSARFRVMDRNSDGVVTRTEWRGKARAFRELDSDNDGVLSGGEVR